MTHFEAVTPEDLPNYEELTFAARKESSGRRFFSDTEKAIWYSHFSLWKRCIELNQPMHVIEHDSYLFDELPDFSDSEIELFAFHDDRYNYRYKYIKHTVSPCAGYYIKPSAARKLVEKSINSVINLNVDWMVHDTYEDFHPETQRKYELFLMNLTPQCVVRQIYDEMIGNTIEHNKEVLGP